MKESATYLCCYQFKKRRSVCFLAVSLSGQILHIMAQLQIELVPNNDII